MEKDNSKVPVAILSCFLIAFILQGVLKLCGVFVFEKAVDWEIFKLIDNSIVLEIIFYSLTVSITVYCLSFAFTTKPYSNKWFHYLIIFGSSILITSIRLLTNVSYQMQIVIDIIIYIIVPLSINFTTDKNRRLFRNNYFENILTISIQIVLYFCYLGLGYWSTLLTSILPLGYMWLTSSLNFLTQIEMYIGIIAFMLSMNLLINKIKEDYIMRLPIDIASEEAKIAELEEKKVEKK